MSKSVKLKKGFTINLAGKAEKNLVTSVHSDSFAIKPSDFPGMLRPKPLVAVGENVKAGTPLLIDKKHDNIMYVSPVSGEVVDLKRGDKRKLLEIIILPDQQIESVSFDRYSTTELSKLGVDELLDKMLSSGVWPNIIQRPYGIVADPDERPKSIFISAFDSHPLAPDYSFIFKGEEKAFQAGIDILQKFTNGSIHVNVNGADEVNPVFNGIRNIEHNKFSGPHPAGNVGVQIHHVDAIGKGDIVWTVNPYGVIQIGKLFTEGKYDATRNIVVAGSEVSCPQYYKTYSGSAIKKFVENNLKSDHVRYISGNVLTGERIDIDGHLGFYHHQFTVIPEGDKPALFGWILPSFKKLSFHRAFGLMSFFNSKNKEYVIDSNIKGEPRAFVQTGAFEKVTPMDILPTYLLKAILAEDFDDMEALGIYEIVEEDLALCEFIDVSKHNIQSIVRDGLNLMQYS